MAVFRRCWPSAQSAAVLTLAFVIAVLSVSGR